MLSLLRKLRLTARLIHPGSSPRSLYKQAKHCVRALAWPAATAEWFRLLEHPALAGVVRHSPRLYQKLSPSGSKPATRERFKPASACCIKRFKIVDIFFSTPAPTSICGAGVEK